jgi:hypothetical protein
LIFPCSLSLSVSSFSFRRRTLTGSVVVLHVLLLLALSHRASWSLLSTSARIAFACCLLRWPVASRSFVVSSCLSLRCSFNLMHNSDSNTGCMIMQRRALLALRFPSVKPIAVKFVACNSKDEHARCTAMRCAVIRQWQTEPMRGCCDCQYCISSNETGRCWEFDWSDVAWWTVNQQRMVEGRREAGKAGERKEAEDHHPCLRAPMVNEGAAQTKADG